MKKILTFILFAIGLQFNAVCAHNNHHQTIQDYSQWINSLPGTYNVAQGNAYLMLNSECPLYVSIFGSCFGQNPAAPYIIPQPPIENSYVDPYYAVPLNTPGPDGTTNIIYRLSDQDALVTIVSYPPEAAFFGYVSYVFTREASYYDNVPAPHARTVSPDPSRYEIFGSIGNDVNNVIVRNQIGFIPWGRSVVVYITTSNELLAEALIHNAKKQGINPDSIFIEKIGSNVITGNDSSADDMSTLMRYAVPRSQTNANTWTDNLSENVLVYKVTNPTIEVSRYGANQYTPHQINNAENTKPIKKALHQLARLLGKYLEKVQSSPSSFRPAIPTTEDNSEGIPYKGLVGSYAIEYGVLAAGDDQDTSTYAIALMTNLGATETAFIVGVNHNVAGLNNTHYVSIDIYNTDVGEGIASTSQTNIKATGFDSGNLNGSAQAVLMALGIKIPKRFKELRENIFKLYVSALTRDVNNPATAAINKYCINLNGTTLLPEGAPLSIAERSYIVPGTTTGGNVNEMLYPLIVAAADDFGGLYDVIN